MKASKLLKQLAARIAGEPLPLPTKNLDDMRVAQYYLNAFYDWEWNEETNTPVFHSLSTDEHIIRLLLAAEYARSNGE